MLRNSYYFFSFTVASPISQDGLTGIQTGQSRDFGFITTRNKRFFSSPKCPHQLCVAHSILFDRYFKLSSWQYSTRGNEAEHLPPSHVRVKNEWNYTSTPPYVLMACTGTTTFTISEALLMLSF
jgi:hypothetical protein